MANIDKYLNDIETAVYGEEVRSAIHDSIRAMNEEIEVWTGLQDGSVTTRKIANGAVTKAKLGTDVNTILDDMKTGFDGVTYSSPAAMVQGEDSKLQNALIDNAGYVLKDKTGVGNITTRWSQVDLDNINQDANYEYYIINVSAGDKFVIYGTGGTGPLLWCFINAWNTKLSESSADATAEGTLITAPDNSAKLVVNMQIAKRHELYAGNFLINRINAINTENEQIKSDLSDNKIDIMSLRSMENAEFITIEKGKEIRTDSTTIGTVVTLSTVESAVMNSAVVNCSYGDLFTLTGKGGSTPKLFGILDSDNKLIKIAGSDVSYENRTIQIPKDGAKIFFNVNTNYDYSITKQKSKYYGIDHRWNYRTGFPAVSSIATTDFLMCAFNSIEFDNTLLTKEKVLHDGNLMHDSTLCVVGDKAYTVLLYNNAEGTSDDIETNTNLKTVMFVCNYPLSTDSPSMINIAKYNDTIDGKTIISGVGLPNAVVVATDIHTFFSAKLSDGHWYLMSRIYDTLNGSFGDPFICKLEDGEGNKFDFSDTNLGEKWLGEQGLIGTINCNATIGLHDSTYYVGLQMGSHLPSGLIMTSTDLKTFSLWKIPQISGSDGIYECACYVYSAKLYYAVRQIDSKMSLVLQKYDLSTKDAISTVWIPDCGSRPSWFEFDGGFYLAHSIANRSRLEIIQVNINDLVSSYIRAQSDYMIAYPSFAKVNNNTIMSATYGGLSTGANVRLYPVKVGNYWQDDIMVLLRKIVDITGVRSR